MNSRGFTITELLVATVVSLLVSLAGWTFYRNQLRVLTDQAARLDATESARAALGFMTREIRRAGYDPKGTALTTQGFRGVSDARADRLLIQWDEDGQGAIEANAADPTPESVLYSYDATNRRILRSVGNGSAQVLISNVPSGGLEFQYLDQNGAPMALSGSPAALTPAQRDALRFVRLRLQVNPTNSQTSVVELAAKTALRNRILGRL